MLASSAHLRCTSRGQLKRATPHAAFRLTDSEPRMRFQYLTTAKIRLSLGTEDQLHLVVKDEPHTHTQDHKRVLSNTQWTDSRSPDSCFRFCITSFSKNQAIDVPPGTKKHKLQDNTVFRKDDDLRLSTAYLGQPTRKLTHPALPCPRGSEAQLLVKAAATHVSLVNGACFQLSSENRTARQLGQATPRL